MEIIFFSYPIQEIYDPLYISSFAGGMGVERVFPYHCPNVVDVKVVSRGKSRRAKHFYLRDRKGKAARIAVDYDRSK